MLFGGSGLRRAGACCPSNQDRRSLRIHTPEHPTSPWSSQSPHPATHNPLVGTPLNLEGSGLGRSQEWSSAPWVGLPEVFRVLGSWVPSTQVTPGRARGLGLPTLLLRSAAAPLPPRARPPLQGPRPGSALPGPGLSGSPRVACFSNFSLSPSSSTSGALPLLPAAGESGARTLRSRRSSIGQEKGTRERGTRAST